LGGVFVDLKADEEVSFQDEDCEERSISAQTYKNTIQIAPSFVLGAGESRVFNGQVQVPASGCRRSSVVTPSTSGRFAAAWKPSETIATAASR
jgi:hypothetical protein